jgi:superfamily I DNA/RNA helicase
LDRYTLVSNSDAHSPPKIGREACAFETDQDYFAMRRALETGQGYAGTVEFFPEEGKYHLDGHRKCGTRLTPPETREHGGLCPACGKALTVGVMNRVEELADRPEGYRPERPAAYRSLVPLPEVIAEVRGVGEGSKKVQETYDELLNRVGAELFVLEQAPLEEIRRVSPWTAEAIRRMRAGQVQCEAGYDGEYGIVRLFEKGELTHGSGASRLFSLPDDDPRPTETATVGSQPWPAVAAESGVAEFGRIPDALGHAGLAAPARNLPIPATPMSATGVQTGLFLSPESRDESRQLASDVRPPSPILDQLDADQRAAAETLRGPLLIVAGPGTGKTRTLTHRIAHLVADHRVAPEQCLAITFSRRAAGEMSERLVQLLPDAGRRVPVMTFHALGLTILKEHAERLDLPPHFRVAGDDERVRLICDRLDLAERQAERALAALSRMKRTGATEREDSEARQLLARYVAVMRAHGLVDFDDLILLPARLLGGAPDGQECPPYSAELTAAYRRRWPWVSVDEYQDIDEAQYRLIRCLVPPDGNLCAIGDPDQAIYGFRGASPEIFLRFTADFPTATTVHLRHNYRSSKTIVDAALQAIAPSSLVSDRIQIHAATSEKAEAEFVVHTIERLIGGSTFFSLDSGRVAAHEGAEQDLSFADFAVLYRTEAQADALVEALARSGIPFQKRSHRRLTEQPTVRAMIERMQPSLAPVLRGESVPHALAPELRGEGCGEGSVAERWRQAGQAIAEQRPEAVEFTRQLLPLAERCEHDLSRFLSDLALGVDLDSWDPRADRVSLLTLHASKGLEFAVVFLVGCEDGIMPLRWGSDPDANRDEERRLFFVGMTRARQRLFLLHARQRLWRGQIRDMPISPFLEQIQEDLLERAQTAVRRKKKTPAETQLQLF